MALLLPSLPLVASHFYSLGDLCDRCSAIWLVLRWSQLPEYGLGAICWQDLHHHWDPSNHLQVFHSSTCSY